ncbi:unnamed protein product [Paramecium primaurelia]|uniref:Transcription and mRNA export factor ENY2 n=1 Tax=Paramecium primaurelia TaxID=5886 RepID=A0A8S1L0D2_PARPR|nr:unnamed protein product [Paramecium primaurelia]
MRSKQGTTIQKSEKSIKSQSEYSDNNVSYTSTRKEMLSERLVNSGEQARLEEYLKQKFIDVGWKDDLKNHAKQFIRENGLKIVHKEDLYKLLSVKGKETVPMKLREDIVRRLERFIIELEQEEEGEYDDEDDV